jgi:membrane-associated phospholipid phosphatase
MYRREILVAHLSIVCSSLISAPLTAQSVGKMLQTDVRNSAGDMWSVWTSPVRATSKDWVIAAAAVGASAAISMFDDRVDRWAIRHRKLGVWRAISGVREGGIAFTGKAITPIAAGALVLGLATKNERLQEGLFGCLSAYGATSVVRNYVVYPLLARTRPDSSRDDHPRPPAKFGDQYDFSAPGSLSNWGRHSTPAGHAANVMACATFLGQRFSMGPVPEVGSYALAASVAGGRILDRRHWLSDTVLGMVFAYGVGKEIAKRSSDREMKTRAGAGR